MYIGIDIGIGRRVGSGTCSGGGTGICTGLGTIICVGIG